MITNELKIPYCPNCRCPITEKSVGWRCWKPKKTDDDGFADLSELNAGKAMEPETGKFFDEEEEKDLELPYQNETSLCRHVNQWSEDTCGGCKEARSRGEFRYFCLYKGCESEIPDLRNVEAKTLTITGPSGAGKTTYTIALYEWWRENLADFGLTRIPAMAELLQKAFKRQRDQLIIKKQKLLPTPEKKMISYSWQLTGMVEGRSKGILVTLPDASGERLTKPEHLAGNRYYHSTSGIIFLLDADRMDGDGRSSEEHMDVALTMVDDLRRRLGEEETAKIPLAVCVNKIDKLRTGTDPRWAEILRNYLPDHNRRFDVEKCVERSNAIWDILAGAGDVGNVVSLFEETFRNIMFFPVATLGSEVIGEEIKWRPIGVEDPFLFLMFHLKFVR